MRHFYPVTLVFLFAMGSPSWAQSVEDDEATTTINTPVLIKPFDNDVGEWIAGSVTQPGNGVVTSYGDGFTYVPSLNFLGEDAFTYTVTDVGGAVLTANVRVTVTGELPSGPPFVQDDWAGTYEGVIAHIAVSANDSGYWISRSHGAASNGTLHDNGPVISYVPNLGFVGTDSFDYTVVDEGGSSLTAAVTVVVEPTLQANDDSTGTNLGMPVAVAVLANDTGAVTGGDYTPAQNGSLSGPLETLVYTPNAGFTGIDTFTYTIRDQLGGSSTATVRVAVTDLVFQDVTAAAGLNHTQHDVVFDPSAPINMPLYMGGGAAAGDYDNDGNVDLYVTRHDANDILYRNNGDGTFDDVTAASGIARGAGSNGAGWGDIDADGDLDLYVTVLDDTRFYLYVNDGSGGFSEEAVARGAAIEGADMHFGYSVAFGDYDKDGYLDIHTCEWRGAAMNPTSAPSNSRLLHNLGAANPGHFEDATQAAGVAIDGVVGTRPGTFSFASRFADMDNDGWPDLVVASDFETSRIFWNDQDGTFTDGTAAAGVGSDENGMGNAVGDANGDGLLDWFVTSVWDPLDICAEAGCGWGTTGNRLFLNNGDRTFTDATDSGGVREGDWGWGSTFIDYDNDGDEDLIMTNGIAFPWLPQLVEPYQNDVMRFFENDGSGVFTEIAAGIGIADVGSGKGLLKFDYDNDGDQDVYVVNNGARGVLYRNDGGNANSWLRIVLDGPNAGVGARVTVRPTRRGAALTRVVTAGSNFLGQDDTTLVVGLGSRRGSVYEVTVEWPQGVVSVSSRVRRNSTLVVTPEG
jgi:hypothetical protein